jgi:hypothetical protein
MATAVPTQKQGKPTMKNVTQQQADASPHAAARTVSPKAAAIADRRPEAQAQRQWQDIANNSPQVATLQRYADLMNNSPRMAAQRKAIEGMFGTAVQKKAPDEEELLQGEFGTAQRKGPEDEELLQGKFGTAQRKGPEDEELLQGRFGTAQRKGPGDEELLQGKFEAAAGPAQRKEQATPNRTGLPDSLKAGVEHLSGLAMDDVRVHYNSDKPAQLQALAYTQGTDIHVAPGQEKHLAHEAWHVVQQKQGRVRPTLQMKEGVPVNDDVGLEREADSNGTKALKSQADLSDSGISHDRRTPSAVSQLKKKGQVTDEYIQDVLKEVENEKLREQLNHAWNLIKDSGGEAFFDDEITQSFGGYDPTAAKLVFRIPEQNFFQWEDTTIDKKGIAIHELTHVAEIAANTGDLHNMDYDMQTTQIMETDLLKIESILERLFELAKQDKEILQSVVFSSSTTSESSLYEYIMERLRYAGGALIGKNSNHEFPTVVNQLIFVVDAKASEAVKGTETYSWLKILEGLMVDSRPESVLTPRVESGSP